MYLFSSNYESLFSVVGWMELCKYINSVLGIDYCKLLNTTVNLLYYNQLLLRDINNLLFFFIK